MSIDLNITRCAKSVIGNYRLGTVAGLPYMFNESHFSYEAVGLEGIRALVNELFPTYYGSVVTEIVENIKTKLKKGKYELPYTSRYISFENCIYDRRERRTLEFSPDLYGRVFIHVPCRYDEKVTSERMENALDVWTCGDEAQKRLLKEMIGYIICHHPTLRKAFVLIGDKRSGKSTFIELLTKLVGSSHVTSKMVGTLSEKFGLSEFPESFMCISPDMPETPITSKEMSLIRSVISFEPVSVEYKHKSSFTAKLPVVMVLGCNRLAEMDDKYGAMLDRLVPIKFSASFIAGENDEPEFANDLSLDRDAMTYLATQSLQAVLSVYDSGVFTATSSSSALLEEIDKENNPEIEYILDHSPEYFTEKRTEDIYDDYLSYCESSGSVRRASAARLKESICIRHKLVVKRPVRDGKRCHVYEKP